MTDLDKVKREYAAWSDGYLLEQVRLGPDAFGRREVWQLIVQEVTRRGLTTRLVDRGADVNAQDEEGDTALIHAAQEGHTELVQTLIEAGADLNLKNEVGGTALMYAAYEGHTETVRLLLDKGASPNVEDEEGDTALIHAAQFGHTDTVQELLAVGADVNVQYKKGWTASMWAVAEGHTQVVDLLRAAGAEEGPDPREIIPGFANVLRRHEGRMAAPDSDLPYPRAQIRGAIHFEVHRLAQSQELSPERREFLKTALVELAAFVPDNDAEIVSAYQNSLTNNAHPKSRSRLGPRESERAEAVLDRIRRAQAELIASMRDETHEAAISLIGGILAQNPVTIGAARKSLNAVEVQRSGAAFGFIGLVALLAWGGACAIAGISGGFQGWQSWQTLVFILISLFSVAVVGLVSTRLYSILLGDRKVPAHSKAAPLTLASTAVLTLLLFFIVYPFFAALSQSR